MNYATLPGNNRPMFVEATQSSDNFVSSTPHRSPMATIPIASVLLLAASGAMLRAGDQWGLCGSCMAGSVIGGLFSVGKWMLDAKNDIPRQLILWRFVTQACGGIMFSVLLSFLVIHWLGITELLVLLGFAAGGLCGWGALVIAKRFEPTVVKILQDRGVLPKDPPDSEPIKLYRDPPVKPTPPTTRLV